MVRINDGEVFVLNSDYDRMEVLKECWKNPSCKKMRFLVLEDGKIIKALSYDDIVFHHSVENNCIQLDADMFINARNFFISRQLESGACIPVVDENGNCVFLAEYYKNYDYFRDITEVRRERTFAKNKFADYELKQYKQYLDYTYVENWEGYVFYEFEEYTCVLTKILMEKYPDKKIFFLDKNVSYYFNHPNIQIIDNLIDIPFGTNYLYVRTEFDFSLKPRESNITNSIMVMKSLFWSVKRNSFGECNPQNTIFLINNETDGGGIGDIARGVYIWSMIAKKRGWIPVVNLNRMPNQYLESEEDNMWEYYFEPLSDISVDEVHKSRHVICANENHLRKIDETNPYFQELNQYLITDNSIDNKSKHTFKTTVKIKSGLINMFDRQSPLFFSKKTLGIIVRGTDLRKEMVHLREGRNGMEIDIPTIIKKCRYTMGLWECDSIFLATEDADYFEQFKAEFGKSLLYVNQKRISFDEMKDGEKFGISSVFEEHTGYEFGLDYLSVLYYLSKCNVLLSSIRCGAYMMARLWKDGEFDYEEVIFPEE